MDATVSSFPDVRTLQELDALHEDLIRRLEELDERVLRVIAEFQPGGRPGIGTTLEIPPTESSDIGPNERMPRAA